ncbi:MAG TPA: 9-O-acetylesterase, partial [Blastocatellia bacterium]|nr:9-O-acetylesterase [Blastocatellia bacterium]
MKRFGYVLVTAGLLLFGLTSTVRAGVHLPSLFSDNMLLQRDRKVRIWGSAEPGERVRISLSEPSGRSFAAALLTADSSGKWQTMIGPFHAGGPYVLTVAGKNTLTFNNVLIGDVWVCSGQSNMEFPLSNAKDADKAIASANYPEIRLFTVRRNTSDKPLDDVHGQWEVSSPTTVQQFSAVAYFFGRDLYQRLHIPIRLIHSSWGGTPAEAWTSPGALEAVPDLKPILDRYANDLNDLPRLKSEYVKSLAEWNHENLYSDPGNKGEGLGYPIPSHDVKDWLTMSLPRYWEATGLNIDGAVWFRREVV